MEHILQVNPGVDDKGRNLGVRGYLDQVAKLTTYVVDHDMSWADFSGAQITPDSHRCRQGSCQASKGQATGLKRGLARAEYDAVVESQSSAAAAC